jgi:hypothetical protein
VRIKVGAVFKVLTDKPLKTSTVLKSEDVKAYLESTIPETAFKCPISTSRNWEQGKHKRENDYKGVTITWLPVKEQAEVAENLGATIQRHARWLSPEEVDEEEWAEKFKEGIRQRKELILWWLKHKM